jgi:hypothetical protein
MPENKSEPPGFRVVDRRNFSSDGSRREPSRETAKPPASRPEPTPPPETEAETEEHEPLGPPGFDMLVSYLSTTAMFQMGLLPGPGGGTIPVDLVNARRTIDLMEVLQEKTRGNLTPDEAKLLDDVLYDLRMSYLGLQQGLTQRLR